MAVKATSNQIFALAANAVKAGMGIQQFAAFMQSRFPTQVPKDYAPENVRKGFSLVEQFWLSKVTSRLADLRKTKKTAEELGESTTAIDSLISAITFPSSGTRGRGKLTPEQKRANRLKKLAELSALSNGSDKLQDIMKDFMNPDDTDESSDEPETNVETQSEATEQPEKSAELATQSA